MISAEKITAARAALQRYAETGSTPFADQDVVNDLANQLAGLLADALSVEKVSALADRLLNDGYEISVRKVDEVCQVRLTGPLGSTSMAEADSLESALVLAADQAGFDQ